eukprot:TRINITY_DN7791_c0_g1_i17.p1 TRINITY_DN7791_c0_g1~~TRINITY_DN7791_c0_g1_i17.p1  ORF type:complete len:318 (-),score=74.23 TRINITY_DN7791_c0_g1_i17:99-1052(-)
MIIEKDARRHVVKAIEYDQELRFIEAKEKLKGRVVIKNEQYELLRRKLVDVCGQINVVANTQGKGRDDLKVEVLWEAEKILRRVSNYKSRAMRVLSLQIKTVFNRLRTLFRGFAENIDLVDPQLKNNVELTEALLAYEKAWEKGKEFLLDEEKFKVLMSMSELIEGLSEKHTEVKDKIEGVDADIFITIPCLAILKALDDQNSKIYQLYYCNQGGKHTCLFDKIKNLYTSTRKEDDYKLYNTLESMLLEKSSDESEVHGKEKLSEMVHDIKELAIVMQRSKPSEWNSLMETSMGIICLYRIITIKRSMHILINHCFT